MEQLIVFFQNFGVLGLFIISFIESIFSPILPDLLLVPMALSVPEKAIYYSIIATVGSVLGGIVGYFIGNKYGIIAVKKYVPNKYVEKINGWLEQYGGWAIFLAALAPIPYKFVSISSGVFRINMVVFLIASVFGRGKRFLLEGILIFYYGPQAIELIKTYSNTFMIGVIIFIVLLAVAIAVMRKVPQRKLS
ncbi:MULTISPECIES: YqaA family protein [Pelosinus]|uniref:SNARE associated protein n=1 Tax=Pelosinus fermentans B4 TaxID=1149862 RepID=I9LFA6_9FIRM|nr:MULTISPECIES: YqaA family protein [Pelosinus]EIW19051.1 SNARE associated protein [Pelosinus fermentans B4]EIW21739.1 SNARE associated protein [Pelosinus fermentans A11]OAM95413.1 SNARE associated protein [Pelosinus fermentans DSM 17108]SDR27738.1 membrane protein YqaA, SNARE-associated domain [Pelosinus fermentans]